MFLNILKPENQTHGPSAENTVYPLIYLGMAGEPLPYQSYRFVHQSRKGIDVDL